MIYFYVLHTFFFLKVFKTILKLTQNFLEMYLILYSMQLCVNLCGYLLSTSPISHSYATLVPSNIVIYEKH